MEVSAQSKPPIINCHTHIFTGNNVPPYIGKRYLWWPFYYLLSIPPILKICRFIYTSPKSPLLWKYNWVVRKLKRILYAYKSFFKRYLIAYIPATLFNFALTYHSIFILLTWLGNKLKLSDNESIIASIKNWFVTNNLLWMPPNFWLKLLIIVFTFFGIKSGRKLILFLLKRAFAMLKSLPSKATLQYLGRYLNIGRFAYYGFPGRIFVALKNQYAAGTGFVILPMDMEYMRAGSLSDAGSYANQMLHLAKLKEKKKANVFPFIFIDPRRKKVDDKEFLSWSATNGTVTLEDCFIKEYKEDKKFSGFKIYPALGYYPFDKNLLALWKYAADNSLPIMTHCIRGTVFYRGTKEKEWGYHPIFKETKGNNNYTSLLLPQLRNEDFTINFTHPLNYLCLLSEPLLRIVVEQTKDKKIENLFGYTNAATPLLYNLEKLKICFGHYGGDDEWQRFFEKDRDAFTSQVFNEKEGITFIKNDNVAASYGILEKAWKDMDWYSLITSMMKRYDNIYADISYILHQPTIVPLLKRTLQEPLLKKRVLFGTDFYVVRNHKSEKEMLANLQAQLTDAEFDAIARFNPQSYLNIAP